MPEHEKEGKLHMVKPRVRKQSSQGDRILTATSVRDTPGGKDRGRRGIFARKAYSSRAPTVSSLYAARMAGGNTSTGGRGPSRSKYLC